MNRKLSTPEFDKFVKLIAGLVNVSHGEIKTKLDAEKKAKKRKRNGKEKK